MWAVLVEAQSIDEIHAEAVRETIAALERREVLAPMTIQQTRDAADQPCDGFATSLDGFGCGVGARRKKEDVSDHAGDHTRRSRHWSQLQKPCLPKHAQRRATRNCGHNSKIVSRVNS
jgi:hypothetical protein